MSTAAHIHSASLSRNNKNPIYVGPRGEVSYPHVSPPRTRKTSPKGSKSPKAKTGGRKRKNKSRRKYKKTHRKRKY